MRWHEWVAAALAIGLGGWMLFDGVRSLTIGDFVTPSSGPYAGQLGPWSHIVAAVGLAPRSLSVKALHIVCGLLWLVAAAALLFRFKRAAALLAAASAASLWYLPFGTVAAVAQLALYWFIVRPRP